MGKWYFRASALFLSVISAANAATVRVPSDQPTIQAGIDAASAGDTVLVSPGTYYENVIFRGKQVVVTSRYCETGDMSFILSTIVNGSRPVHADTASCVLFINHEDSTAVLQGFTLTGGKGTAWLDEHGAGRYREGGGILSAAASPVIRCNLIINNEAINKTGLSGCGGGGIRAGDGNPKILNNIIAYNTGGYGAGVVLNYTGAIVRNNLICRNSGGQDFGGGALWMNHDGTAPKIIENNTIALNNAAGGGVYVWQGSSVVRNCIVWGNTSATAAQIGVRSGGPAVSYSDVQGGYAGTGNISDDPAFADSTRFGLTSASPCIDAGDDATSFNDPERGTSAGTAAAPSQGGVRSDIGAYGGPGRLEFPLYSSPTGIRSHGTNLPSKIELRPNWPDPFNPDTMIAYSIPERTFITLNVVDMLGRGVATLANGVHEPGEYHVRFNGAGLASGVYYFVLRANGRSITENCMLLK